MTEDGRGKHDGHAHIRLGWGDMSLGLNRTATLSLPSDQDQIIQLPIY
jgi:hypothetical protein